ncbi:MAG: oligopeptide transporter, OPT family [Acidobacteria bacterium]|nr:oligopeptide transporter, OPT family [Acidobacteriota bacterium]
MADKEFKPYVPAKTDMKELTLRAVFFGAIFSVILGAANAYIGLKVGLTVAATFPAAVMAMAILKPMKGSVLEENIFRTTAAVGEALVAGAIFTLPAFILSGVWTEFKYVESTVLMLLGGILGVLFVIFLRRALIEDKSLGFPESVACAEIVKAGQSGKSGAGIVFGAIGISALIEFLKNSKAFQILDETVDKFYRLFEGSKINFADPNTGKELVSTGGLSGGIMLRSPAASPAMMGVGYIIGIRLSAVVFAGGVFAWLFLVPLLNYVFGNQVIELLQSISHAKALDGSFQSVLLWNSIVRPMAVGAMLIGAIYTLYSMRKSLLTGIARVVQDIRSAKAGTKEKASRLDEDLPYNLVVMGIIALVIPIAVVYYTFCKSVIGAIVAALVMTIAGFLFAAVAGFLVGTIGSSNNPISGLTLTTLILAALMMVILGVTGQAGIAAVLGVATVVCCSSGVAGDITQDLKVGHILGGTPKKMEIAVIIGVIAAALFMVFPLQALHNQSGIGSEALPAPQAGLMSMLSQGIVGGEMAWPLLIAGIGFTIGLILIKSPSPMLIAVGMYLPLQATFAIFVGGVIKWWIDRIKAKKKLSQKQSEAVENKGILLASGFIAGEAIMGILIAFAVIAMNLDKSENLFGLDLSGGTLLGGWGGLIIFALIAFLLIKLPLGDAKKTK